MGMFSSATQLGVASGRQKVASEEDERSFLERHPAIATAIGGGVGASLGRGVIGGLAGRGIASLNAAESPNTVAALKTLQDHSGRLGIGLGAGAGHYLATQDHGGSLGRSALAGGLAGVFGGSGDEGFVSAVSPYRTRALVGSGLAGALVGPGEKEASYEDFAEEHPYLAQAGHLAATGVGGALGAYGAGRLRPHLPTSVGQHVNLVGYGLPAAGGALGAGLANYATGGDGLEASMAGLGAGLGQMGAQYGANYLGPQVGPVGPSTHPEAMYPQAGTMANIGIQGARFGGGAALGGAGAAAATRAARKKKDGEKRSFEEGEDPSLLQRIGRTVATGAGGALAGWGAGAALNRWAPGFRMDNPNWSRAIEGGAAGLGAGGANYLAGGDGMSAGVSALGAGLGQGFGRYGFARGMNDTATRMVDPRAANALSPEDAASRLKWLDRAGTALNYGGGGAAGGMLADVGMQAAGY